MNVRLLKEIIETRPRLRGLNPEEDKTAIPRVAKDPRLLREIEEAVKEVPTHHRLVLGDARRMDDVPDESVHLVVTSPPYWTLKEYPQREGQLGNIEDYEEFLDQLDEVWHHCLRVLAPGGRMAIVVGDVCLPRRRFGRHVVMPLHASILERCRRLGFETLAPIVWYKIANISLEVEGGSRFLGKPYEPNAIVKNDIEFILLLRKPGYRSPSPEQRLLSVIPEEEHKEWFRQIWQIPGERTKHHPAPFPLELAERLVRMFSFVGDTVLDPFMGIGTTNLAAGLWGRNSIGYEIEPLFFERAVERLGAELPSLFVTVEAIRTGEKTNLPT